MPVTLGQPFLDCRLGFINKTEFYFIIRNIA